MTGTPKFRVSKFKTVSDSKNQLKFQRTENKSTMSQISEGENVSKWSRIQFSNYQVPQPLMGIRFWMGYAKK